MLYGVVKLDIYSIKFAKKKKRYVLSGTNNESTESAALSYSECVDKVMLLQLMKKDT